MTEYLTEQQVEQVCHQTTRLMEPVGADRNGA